MVSVIDEGKRDVLGISVDVVDYDAAVARIIAAAHRGEPYGVTALAVHGVMTGVDDEEHAARLNELELVTPDGQPVRWALRLLHGCKLPDRVYGPRLTLRVAEAAAAEGLPLFLYGSKPDTVERMAKNLEKCFPGLVVAGNRPSLFRQTTVEERDEIVIAIRASGAKIVLAGLGCPRQEVFAFEYRRLLSMPVLAVGAAFDYIAGDASEPPELVQRLGLQWLYRLAQDPRRLWRRYLILNPRFLARLATARFGRDLSRRDAVRPPAELRWG